MRSLLFLAHRMPFPPTKGDKVRSFAVLKALARTWRVHLGCFVDDPADWQHVEGLKAYCESVCCVPLDKRWARVRSLMGLVRGTSLSEAWFHSPRLQRWTESVLADQRPEAAFLFSSVMAQYLPARHPLRPRRVVMDYIDVDSDKWAQYAKTKSWPTRWIYRREARTLFEFDRAAAYGLDACVFVSEAEADLFRRLVPRVAGKVWGISNGIDHGFFSPEPRLADPFSGVAPTVVFTGAMDYWPNIDAVLWFAAEIFPKIRLAVPGVRFVVVGANPSREVLRLAEQEDIAVTGRVPDVRPYLAHATAVVAPLRVARGIQNKVLEGMSMGRVVVTTPQGFEGLEAEPGRHLLVAADATAFASAVVRVLLGDPSLAGIGEAARARVVEFYDWSDKLAAYHRLLSD
ncbi:MAG: TIGR03087 family PEP-CTERM/XrtA system glycosyltransferase [Solirubrobacterales bacterium]